METLDLTHDWWLHDDGQDVLITGPGHLEIVLAHFDASKLAHEEGLGSARIGTLRQLSWTYPLGSILDSVASDWQLRTTWDSAAPDVPPQHRMHIGLAVSWQLPQEVGQRLQGWLARKEEPAPDTGSGSLDRGPGQASTGAP